MEKVGISQIYNGLKLFYIVRKPAHLSVLLRDWRRARGEVHPDREHLTVAMGWLCRAQDVAGCGGVSAGYGLAKGWKPPFPETTGYIIPTFLAYAAWSGQDSYRRRAMDMGDWEISIQLPGGGVRGGVGINDQPLVFDTGQVILGWTALYRETKLVGYLEAAVRAADWLVQVQDEDGGWARHTFQGLPRVYHARVAWSLLALYRLTEEKIYRDAAQRHVDWVLARATENGWFHQMGFERQDLPLTHTIAYTLRGLLECEQVLGGGKALELVQRASGAIIEAFDLASSDGPQDAPAYLPATLDERWTSGDGYSCLTGNAQLAILWLKLYLSNGDPRLRLAAGRLIDGVKAVQSIGSGNKGILGAVAGSRPVWGGYLPLTYPNWAAKFLADALLLMIEVEGGGKEKGSDGQ